MAYANNGLLEKSTPKSTEAVALADNSATTQINSQAHVATPKPQGPDKSYAEVKAILPAPLLQILAALEDLVQPFGDGVQFKELRLYIAFKTLRNFASVVRQRSRLLVYLHQDMTIYTAQIQHRIPSARDVSAIGHWGTGDIETPSPSLLSCKH